MKRKETTRPYRLVNTKTGHEVRWHYFKIAINCHYAALKLLHAWAQIGVTYQLWNVTTGRLLATYKRTTTGITWDRHAK